MNPLDLLNSILPEVRGLADLTLIALTWVACVMIRGVVRAVFKDPPWLATEGNRDLIVPFVLVLPIAVVAEWSTPEFNPLLAMKKVLVLGGGVFFGYRPSLFLQALPDWALNLWPNVLGGDSLRSAVTMQAAPSPLPRVLTVPEQQSTQAPGL